MKIKKDSYIKYVKEILEKKIIEENDFILEDNLNSLEIIRFISTLNEKYNISLTFVDFFEKDFTYKTLYDYINNEL